MPRRIPHQLRGRLCTNLAEASNQPRVPGESQTRGLLVRSVGDTPVGLAGLEPATSALSGPVKCPRESFVFATGRKMADQPNRKAVTSRLAATDRDLLRDNCWTPRSEEHT